MGYVVAFSGTSGAGKSALMRHVQQAHGDCAILHFDDYISLGTDLEDIQAWVASGAPADAIETPQLPLDLTRLVAKQAVTPPGREKPIEPAQLILLEDPFGRARSAIRPHIDHALHLELPHDLALARRSLRTIHALTDGEAPDTDPLKVLDNLKAQFDAYLGPGRLAYQLAEAQARAVSDLILDARKPLATLTTEALASIKRARTEKTRTQ